MFSILPTGFVDRERSPSYPQSHARRATMYIHAITPFSDRARSTIPKKNKSLLAVYWIRESLIFSNSPSRPQRAVEDEKNDRLVVTPLVSIMKEQVEEMKRLGLKVFAIGLGEEEAEKKLRVTSCEVDIMYGSPESWCDPIWSK